jgi:hypothetical protein
MVESPLAGGTMQVKEFVPAPRLDYVRGVDGGWTRQIAFIKNADSLAPNYFVIADTLDRPVTATWRLWCVASNLVLSSPRALVTGMEDVDTDVFFLQPNGVTLKTDTKTIKTAGLNAEGTMGQESTTQSGIIVTVSNGTAFSTVIYPRLKSESAPAFTTLAEGKAARIRHPKGTDYVFLSPTPFQYTEGDIAFEGTAGLILLRGDRPTLVLGGPGRLTAGGHVVTKE